MVDQATLKQMSHDIHAKLSGVLGVYLFGSVAKGTSHARSDVDLAVLCDHVLPVMDVWLLAQSLAKSAGVDVDLLELRRASTVMRMQIITEGRRLLCMDKAACGQFEDFVYVDFARLNEERSAILMDIRSRGTVYG